MKTEEERVKKLLDSNVEELLKISLEEDWTQATFERWLKVKEIQLLEKIANKGA